MARKEVWRITYNNTQINKSVSSVKSHQEKKRFDDRVNDNVTTTSKS